MNTIILTFILIILIGIGIVLYKQRHKIKIDLTEYKDPGTGKDYRDTGHIIIYVNNSDVSPALVPDDVAIIRVNLRIQDLVVGDIVYTTPKKFYRISKIDYDNKTIDLSNINGVFLKDLPESYIIGKLVGKEIS